VIPRPSASDLEGLSSARWGLLVPHLRAALAAVTPGSASPAAERLRDAPPSALGSGRRRRELCRVVAEDELVWMELARRLDPLPDELAWVAGIGANDADEGDGGADGAGRPGAEGARLRERLREVQQERAELRRRLEGAEARAERAEQRARLAEADLARIEDERAELARAIEDADASRRRALERGERRAEGELERLRSELTALRRELGAVTTERDEARSRTSRVEADLAALRARPPVAPERAGRAVGLRPGRPSRLPPGVEDATTEAAELLLHPGRLVLIDGYNLTLRHRGHLDLAQQRAWLATTMAAFVARVRIRPVLVFDGERAGGNRTMPPARGVDVVFTSESVIADDEIVLAVEATDEPVVVVTDDQELRARVRALGADVVPTSNLLGVVGG
jgi:predicted RNA-binding protein with PIN domain